MGDDTQQRAAGWIQTRAAAKASAYMGRTLLLGELEVAPKIDISTSWELSNKCKFGPAILQ